MIRKIEIRNTKNCQWQLAIATIFIFCFSFSYAQKFDTDFLRIQEFNKREKVKIEYTMQVLMTDGTRDTTVNYSGMSLRYKDKYYSKNELTESLCNGDTLLVVDYFNKQIYLYSSKVLDKLLNTQQVSFDKLNTKHDSVALLSDTNGIKNYMIYFKEGQVLKMNLFVGSDGRVLETGMYYKALPEGRAGMKSSITKYTNYNLNVEKKDFTYHISSYLLNGNQGLRAVKTLEGYRIKNLLN